VVALASAAYADIIGQFTVTAEDMAGHRASVSFDLTLTGPGQWSCGDSTPIELRDPNDNTLLGLLNPDLTALGLSPEDMAAHDVGGTGLMVTEDPSINQTFAVQAGFSTTIFTIESALLDIVPDITNASGVASSSVAVTDITADGATFDGLAPGSTGDELAYRAAYNGFAGAGLGTTFAEFFDVVVAPIGQTQTAQDNQSGSIALAQDMSTVIKFSLSPFDLASGVATYNVVPEPGTLLLLVAGGLLLRRRR